MPTLSTEDEALILVEAMVEHALDAERNGECWRGHFSAKQLLDDASYLAEAKHYQSDRCADEVLVRVIEP